MFSVSSILPGGATVVIDSLTGKASVLQPGVWQGIEGIADYDAQAKAVKAALKAAEVASPQDSLDPNTVGASTGSESGSK